MSLNTRYRPESFSRILPLIFGILFSFIQTLPFAEPANAMMPQVVSYGTLQGGNEEFCASGNPALIRFSVLPSGAASFTYRWYFRNGINAAPTGSSTTGWTAISATANSYDPPSGLTLSRTYACRVTPLGGTAAWATGVRQVTVNKTPALATLTNGQRCGAGSVELKATTSAGSVLWYSSLSEPPAGSGPVFITPSISSSQTFYAVAVNGNCPASPASAVSATINPVPLGGTLFSEPIISCSLGPNPFYYFSSLNAGKAVWYDAPAGGTALDTTTFSFPPDYFLFYGYETFPLTDGPRTLWYQLISAAGCQSSERYYSSVGYADPGDFGRISGEQVLTAPANPDIISAGYPPFVSMAPLDQNFSWYYKEGIVPAPTGNDLSGWTLVASDTMASYDPPGNIMNSRTYAVRVLNGCGFTGWSSGVYYVRVLKSGKIAAGNQTLCNGGDPNIISFSEMPESGSSFQWYYKDGISPAPLTEEGTEGWISAGVSSLFFDPPSGLTSSRTYACRVSNSGISFWASGVRQLTVLPPFNPGTLMANQTGCTGYNPVKINMATGPAGSPAYNWRWYYWENTTQTCPSGSTIPTGAITSNSDTRFFSTTPATSGATISFDPQSAGANGRTWAVLISPAGSATTPACAGPRFAGTCHRTLKSAGCREAVSENGEQVGEEFSEPSFATLNPVFPNPGSGNFQFRFFVPKEGGSARIIILNTSGKLVGEVKSAGTGWNELNADLSGLPSGLYFYGLEYKGIVEKKEKLIKIN